MNKSEEKSKISQEQCNNSTSTIDREQDNSLVLSEKMLLRTKLSF